MEQLDQSEQSEQLKYRLARGAACAFWLSVQQDKFSEQPTSFNYTASITNMHELDEMRMQNKKFFDPAEINKEVNDRLNAILTQDLVENKIKEQWLSES